MLPSVTHVVSQHRRLIKVAERCYDVQYKRAKMSKVADERENASLLHGFRNQINLNCRFIIRHDKALTNESGKVPEGVM